jgi:hypothetical protein
MFVAGFQEGVFGTGRKPLLALRADKSASSLSASDHPSAWAALRKISVNVRNATGPTAKKHRPIRGNRNRALWALGDDITPGSATPLSSKLEQGGAPGTPSPPNSAQTGTAIRRLMQKRFAFLTLVLQSGASSRCDSRNCSLHAGADGEVLSSLAFSCSSRVIAAA